MNTVPESWWWSSDAFGEKLGMEAFWTASVAELATVTPSLGAEHDVPAIQARHRLYLLLLTAMQSAYWLRNEVLRLGFNISAIAVSPSGELVDFALNNALIANSSVEHAESRLVRRLFSLGTRFAYWAIRTPPPAAPPALRLGDEPDGVTEPAFPLTVEGDWQSTLRSAAQASPRRVPSYFLDLLKGFTVYTTLEPCIQCAGIMAMAGIDRVVYVQRDPEAQGITSILYNLAKHTRPAGKFQAPEPWWADAVGFGASQALETRFKAFCAATPPGKPRPFITTFLRQKEAREVFDAQATAFGDLLRGQSLPTEYVPDYRPPALDPAAGPSPLSNAEVFAVLRQFWRYVTGDGALLDRRTPNPNPNDPLGAFTGDGKHVLTTGDMSRFLRRQTDQDFDAYEDEADQ